MTDTGEHDWPRDPDAQYDQWAEQRAIASREEPPMETDLEGKPDWWPRNPYPKALFTMDDINEYVRLVPDPSARTSLSGMLGRMFWELAEKMIWHAYKEHLEDLTDA